jgi:acyl-CoA synthetase (AMP-forming)/AMP-acid ligase II
MVGRPPPTTFEAIEAIALREPQRLALVEGASRWTYGQFYLGLLRFSRLLADLGIQRGQRVAVSQPGFALALLLLIACENVGAVSAVFDAEGDPDAASLFALVDWVLSEQPQPGLAPSNRFQLLDQAFADRAAAIDPQDGRPAPRIALAAGRAAAHHPHLGLHRPLQVHAAGAPGAGNLGPQRRGERRL